MNWHVFRRPEKMGAIGKLDGETSLVTGVEIELFYFHYAIF